jgi:hypothetical protein
MSAWPFFCVVGKYWTEAVFCIDFLTFQESSLDNIFLTDLFPQLILQRFFLKSVHVYSWCFFFEIWKVTNVSDDIYREKHV